MKLLPAHTPHFGSSSVALHTTSPSAVSELCVSKNNLKIMSSRGKIERWLLADWNGGRLLKSSSMIRVTEEVNVGMSEASHRAVTPKTDVVSDGANCPAEVQRSLQTIKNISASNRSDLKKEDRDYSPSASSWEPSDEDISSDSASELSHGSQKVSYTKQYSNKNNIKRAPKPTHRPNAVANILKARQINGTSSNRKRTNRELVTPISVKKYSADSTKRNHTPPIELSKRTIDKNAKEIEDIKAGFCEVFKMLNEFKPQSKKFVMELCTPLHQQPGDKIVNTNIGSDDYEENSHRSESEDSDRSNDNVLISNKFNRMTHNVTSKQESKCDSDDEWVPIGSGKTMIHKDKFRKVKWKSYTIATRTLLLAAFPRRILATHSLTGKRSPAFQNKPAKMCLDPKTVTDIILEITSRFNVKENLVRSIITTKCADECKMLKTRLKSRNKRSDENAQPYIEKEQK